MSKELLRTARLRRLGVATIGVVLGLTVAVRATQDWGLSFWGNSSILYCTGFVESDYIHFVSVDIRIWDPNMNLIGHATNAGLEYTEDIAAGIPTGPGEYRCQMYYHGGDFAGEENRYITLP